METILFTSVRTVVFAALAGLQQEFGGVCWRRYAGAEQEVFVLGQILRWSLFGGSSAVQKLPLQQGQVRLQEGNDEGSQGEVCSFLQSGVKLFDGDGGVHQRQHQVSDALSDLGRDVVAELLQGCEEALEFAQLSRAAGGWKLLIGQRRGR